MRVIRNATSVLVMASVALIGGCATHHATPVAEIAPPAPPVVAVSPPPPGSYPGMPIPARLADGSYATPNRALSSAAAIWHFRAGLNVAALACRGPSDALVAPRYNAILARQRSVLSAAEAKLAAEYRSGGGAAWRDRYDHAMTVLYNFFSQGFAHDTFCASASRILAESETVEPAAFPAFASARLPQLDAVFTDFYARYDAWRAGRAVAPAAPVAVPAPPLPAPSGPPLIVASRRAAPRTTPAPPSTAPRIELAQVALLPDPSGREVRAGSLRALAARSLRR